MVRRFRAGCSGIGTGRAGSRQVERVRDRYSGLWIGRTGLERVEPVPGPLGPSVHTSFTGRTGQGQVQPVPGPLGPSVHSSFPLLCPQRVLWPCLALSPRLLLLEHPQVTPLVPQSTNTSTGTMARPGQVVAPVLWPSGLSEPF